MLNIRDASGKIKERSDLRKFPYRSTFIAAHELENNSNHVVVLPRSINIVRRHIL